MRVDLVSFLINKFFKGSLDIRDNALRILPNPVQMLKNFLSSGMGTHNWIIKWGELVFIADFFILNCVLISMEESSLN